MLKSGLVLVVLAATAVAAVPSRAATPPNPAPRQAWVGPEAEPAESVSPVVVRPFFLPPMSTPSSYVRAFDRQSGDVSYGTYRASLTYQRLTASGTGPDVVVLTTSQVPANQDRPVASADDTHVRFVAPTGTTAAETLTYLDSDGTSTPVTYDLGLGSSPALATDSGGSSMVLYRGGASGDSILARTVSSAVGAGLPAVLQVSGASGLNGAIQVTATAPGTFLALWGTSTPDSSGEVPCLSCQATLRYATYAAGTWSTPVAVPGAPPGLPYHLVTTAARSLLVVLDQSTRPLGNAILAYASGTWTTLPKRPGPTLVVDLATAPDGTVYAGNGEDYNVPGALGVLAPGSNVWTEAPALPHAPGFSVVGDDSLSLHFAWDPVAGTLRHDDCPYAESTCAISSWLLSSVPHGRALFTPIDPKRVTPNPNPVGPGKTVSTALVDLPREATAAAITVSGVNPTEDTYLTAYPLGEKRPAISNLNLTKGHTSAESTVVRLGSSRIVSFFNFAGTVGLVVDVTGYWGPNGVGFVAVPAHRVLDTRTGHGPLGGVPLTIGTSSLLPSDATAAALNMTGTQPTATTWLAMPPHGQARQTSVMNLGPGETATNLVNASIGYYRGLDLFNRYGSLQVIADLEGYYAPSGAGTVLLSATRVLDSRTSQPLVPGGTLSLSLAGRVPVAATGVLLTVTGVKPRTTSMITAYASGTSRPPVPSVTVGAGRVSGNLVQVALGASQQVTLYGAGATENVVVELQGYFL